MSTTTAAPGAMYAPPDTAPGATPTSRAARIVSLDIVRGAVMILMAIDHVRVYAGVPPGGPTASVFFTRWVTHFCAPAFVFLAGTAALLHGRKLGSKGELSKFLLTRGLWLIVLELTVLRFAWTFNFDYANFTFAGVIWAIGWCMVLMAGLIHLPMAVITAVGVVMVAGHNVVWGMLPSLMPAIQESPLRWLWQVLYVGGSFQIGEGGPTVAVLYSIVPWVGVMALGYAFGTVMSRPVEERRRVTLSLGIAAVLAFLVLRGFDLYGDPRPWSAQQNMPAMLAFLNTAKYPASLLFLLMTLGPTLIAVALLEHSRGRLARWIAVFGRVPFFYYVLHIPLIHVAAVLLSLVRTPESTSWLIANHPLMPPDVPDGYRYSLPLLYAMFALVVVALYFPCRWFAELKARRKDAVLSYL
jgi:uncharacterized membrane protein